MSTVQIVNEDKEFASDVDAYLASQGLDTQGLDYHTVAVFGSQSSGKSTLLNNVFGTQFAVMDANARKQTTHGIWLGHDKAKPSAHSPLLILDVEGTDGRERGDDQDFERKAALFALATSEILVVNMWENQIGLYFGANMALLRTVFEVNLSLFVAGGSSQRSRILFVIRDFTNQTPLSQLGHTLREDLNTQWTSLAKPPGLENSCVDDFFDVDVACLPHKVWQPEQFVKECDALRVKIDESFKPEYHRQVPIDGWSVYALNVWQKIEENKDLDLPSHHELVAKYRCEEIANECYNTFLANCDGLGLGLGQFHVGKLTPASTLNSNKEKGSSSLPTPQDTPATSPITPRSALGSSVYVAGSGAVLSAQRKECLAKYDEIAGRYHKRVYQELRQELVDKIDTLLSGWHAVQLDAAVNRSLAKFKAELTQLPPVSSELNLGERISKASEAAKADFNASVKDLAVEGAVLPYEAHLAQLDERLQQLAQQARRDALAQLLRAFSRTVTKKLDAADTLMVSADKPFPWLSIRELAEEPYKQVLDKQGSDLGLGGSDEENRDALVALESELWLALALKARALASPDAVVQRLRDRFEEVFKYTRDGLPMVWAPGDDISSHAVKARAAALELIPRYKCAIINDEGEILSCPENVQAFLTAKGDEVPDFDELLTQSQISDIEKRFQRLADSGFIEAKRSVMQMNTRIPTYILVLLVVLGWNEFMIVVRNPFILALGLLLAGAWYILYTLRLTAPALDIARSYTNHAVRTTKAMARDYLLQPDQISEKPTSSPASRSSPSPSPDSDLYVSEKATSLESLSD